MPSSSMISSLSWRECPPHPPSVDAGHCRLGRGGIGHLDKAKAPRAASLWIRDDADLLYVPIRFKQLAQLVFRGCKGEIPDKNPHG
jgi:hypothetical protein